MVVESVTETAGPATDVARCNGTSWFWNWFGLTPSSPSMLRAVEKKILSCVKTAYRGWFVDIGPVVGSSDKIWTISLNVESKKTPILMLHGLGAGVALWCLNLDTLAATRPVYAIDILGFGRSSRPTFSCDAAEAESQLVKSIEEWRREMKLDKFILLGHSLGGFLAASYAIQYPQRVHHLILADPWGFPEKPPDVYQKAPIWLRAAAYALQPFNPLWAVRAIGPFGQWLIGKVRPDITRKYTSTLEDAEELIPQYIYQCNSQKPSGESAFHSMMSSFGWAKNPMISRIDTLDKDVPITLLYGSRSWVDSSSSEAVKIKRPDSYVAVQVITGAGHHVYADKSDVFNRYVVEVCDLEDSVTRIAHISDEHEEVSGTESQESIVNPELNNSTQL